MAMLSEIQALRDQPWPEQSGIARVQFETSQGVYWLEYVPLGGKFKRAILAGAAEYLKSQGLEAQFAFVREIPPGAQEGMDIEGLTLVQSGWVQPRFVAVGRGAQELIQAEFSGWRKVWAS